jgi:hypothetical protein
VDLTADQSIAGNKTFTGTVTLASPAMTGTPTAPTAAAGTNTTQVATTAFVAAALAAPPGIASDARLKKDIMPISNGLSTVMKMNPVSYLKKPSLAATDYNIKENGFIAQELMQILPDVVLEARDTEKIFKVNYISIIPVLTKAIQEQQQVIVNQQKQIDELKALVNQLLNKKQ